jgi:hypothetical protein
MCTADNLTTSFADCHEIWEPQPLGNIRGVQVLLYNFYKVCTVAHNTFLIVKTHYTGDMFRLNNSHHQAYVNIQTITDHAVHGICSYELPSRFTSTFYSGKHQPPHYPSPHSPKNITVCLPIHTHCHRRPSVNMWFEIIGTVPSVTEDRETVAYYLNF